MKITESNRVFIIETKSTHYVMAVDCEGVLNHLYWGKPCKAVDYISSYNGWEKNSNHSARELSKTEYITFGGTVYRPNAFSAKYADGCRETLLTYDSHKITQKDNSLLLEIVLKDEPYNLFVTLCYRVREGYDVIERFAKIKNNSDDLIILDKTASGEFNFPSHRPYTSTNANGSWGAEFRMESTELKNGVLSYESKKGGSGHTNNPFFILSQNADEKQGEVYFGALAWSGNFKVELSRDYSGITRAVIGVNDFDFSYNLKAGEEFVTPSVFCGYTNGFAEMSNQMNSYAVEYILPERYAKEPLPVLYNSWEATAFDVSCEGQQALAEIAASIGCELFVMDDGWFGERKNDCAGLGDWYVNERKFPNGLKPLIDRVKELGMKFGLWFEPEMVNPDSDLFRAHPEWTYHYDTRKASLLRNQLVLNLTKDDVKEYVFSCMDSMLSQYDISYIKWDMNRAFSETGAENLENPQELWYRHIKAVYEIADALKAKYKDLQIECCASGGGRADLGSLSHFDMVWTSDNTDPLDRLEIQHGFSLLYPIKCMRAWVTDTNRRKRPNDLDYRFNVSMQGSLSIGGNLLKYTKEELETHRKYIELYKSIRETVQFGRFYRLADFERDKIYASQYADDKQSVVFVCSNANSFFNDKFIHINLAGLEAEQLYEVKYNDNVIKRSGSFLMNAGLDFEFHGPLNSLIITLKRI